MVKKSPATKRGKHPGKARKFPKGSKTYGYTAASPAVCIVVHDLGGLPVNDKIAEEISDAVTELAVKYGYVVNWTRQ